jgi:hypothetical protein
VPLQTPDEGLGGFGLVGPEVALDEGVGQLPLRPGELHPVPLEPCPIDALLAEPLAVRREVCDLLQEHLDGGAGMPTPKT